MIRFFSRCAQALIGIAAIYPSTTFAADGLERPAAINGSTYAIVAPTFNSSTATSSYLRLFNGGVGNATFNVTMLGNLSGNTYGTVAISIPQNASPQFAISTLRGMANAAALAGGDSSYSLYVTSTEPWASYQHVTYNGTTTLFGNGSVCAKSSANDVHGAHGMAVLTNIHTGLLSGYPSTIYIHNPNSVSVMYRILITDAGTADSTTGALSTGAGLEKVSRDLTVGANQTFAQSFSTFAAQGGWTATGTQYHANVIAYDPNGTYGPPVLAQSIFNSTLSGSIDMSTGCSVTQASQVASALTTASLTRYCVTTQITGQAADKLILQRTASGAVTIYSVDPGEESAWDVGTGQITGATLTGSALGGAVTVGGTVTGTSISGTISGGATGTFSGATCN